MTYQENDFAVDQDGDSWICETIVKDGSAYWYCCNEGDAGYRYFDYRGVCKEATALNGEHVKLGPPMVLVDKEELNRFRAIKSALRKLN